MVGSAFNKAAMVRSDQGFETQAHNRTLNRGVMEVENMSGYQYNALQAQPSLMSTHRNTLRSASFRQDVRNIYEEMALPDGYLYGYFAQVGNQIRLFLCSRDALIVRADATVANKYKPQ